MSPARRSPASPNRPLHFPIFGFFLLFREELLPRLRFFWISLSSSPGSGDVAPPRLDGELL